MYNPIPRGANWPLVRKSYCRLLLAFSLRMAGQHAKPLLIESIREFIKMGDNEEFSSAGLSHQRLNDLLETLGRQGLTQAQVAAKAGLPVQYLSDIKHERRPMTELVARRIGDEFDVNFQWLMGISNSMADPKPRVAASIASSSVWLPLLPHPIEGEPRGHPKWDGAGVDIAGAAAAKLVLAQQPYILRFGHKDIEGRLRQGDLILISQAPNRDAEISVVRHRRKSFLARPNDDGTWSRVADGSRRPSDCEIAGHCLGIVWSSLYP